MLFVLIDEAITATTEDWAEFGRGIAGMAFLVAIGFAIYLVCKGVEALKDWARQ